MTIASIVLAAGQGTRMRSKMPKVLHLLAGKPLIWHSMRAVKGLTDTSPLVVVGYKAEAVRQAMGDQYGYILQAEQLGTGHAVACARSELERKADTLLVTFGDMPLLRRETLQKLVELHRQGSSPVTMTSFIGDDARGFGRVVRNGDGDVTAIVEQADAAPEQLMIREYNVSAYCFEASWLWEALEKIPVSPKGEYYLTDVIGLAVAGGHSVQSLVLEDPTEAIGINTRVDLAAAEEILRQRINQQWMLEGVTLIDPATTYIEAEVIIGKDTIVQPNTHLRGLTVIGEDCVIGPDTIVQDSRVGNRAHLLSSTLEGARVEDDVSVGPYCHLRQGSHLAIGVHLGNYAEVKDSYLGPHTKMGHFSYIGNARIGSNVNIGAGTITCNYDGKKKNPTEIGDDVFIGSDTMLVAPVKIGDRAVTAAGAVVTRDVPPDTLVMGVPAKEKRKLEKSD